MRKTQAVKPARLDLVWRLFRATWWWEACQIVGIVIWQVSSLVVPLVQGHMITLMAHGHVSAREFVTPLSIWVTLLVANIVGTILRTFSETRGALAAGNIAREESYLHAMTRPFAVASREPANQTLAQFRYINGAVDMVTKGPFWVVGLGIGVVGAIAGVAVESRGVLLACLPFVLLYAVGPRMVTGWLRSATQRAIDAQVALDGVLLDHFGGLRDLRVHGALKWGLRHARKAWTDLIPARMGAFRAERAGDILGWLLMSAATLTAWVVALGEIMHGRLAIGGLWATSQYVAQMFGPLDRLLSFQYQIVGWMVNVDRATAFLRTPGDAQSLGGTDGAEDGSTAAPVAVALEDVTYSFPGATEAAVKGVSCSFVAGTVNAVLGANGSGKSTVLDLIAGLLEPEEGRVLVGGVDIGTEPGRMVRTRIGYAGAAPHVFRASVRENIAFGRSVPADAVVRAMESVGLGPWVRALPQGLEATMESGAGASTGERQKIGLARTLVGRHSLLLLDEATANLDVDTAGRWWEYVMSLRGECTVIAAVHDLSLARAADYCVVMEHGRVVQAGAPATVLGAQRD